MTETELKMHRKPPRRAILLVGQTYRTGGGFVIEVKEKTPRGYLTESERGWVQEIHGVWQHPDGHIEWDFSTGRHWKEGV